MWFPMVVHSLPLMTPMCFTDRMVKKRSLSARSFQFLFIVARVRRRDDSAAKKRAPEMIRSWPRSTGKFGFHGRGSLNMGALGRLAESRDSKKKKKHTAAALAAGQVLSRHRYRGGPTSFNHRLFLACLFLQTAAGHFSSQFSSPAAPAPSPSSL